MTEYETTDLWEAAYLLALDVRLLRTERQGHLVAFVFDNRSGTAVREGRRWATSSPAAPARPLLKAWKWVYSRVGQVHQEAAA